MYLLCESRQERFNTRARFCYDTFLLPTLNLIYFVAVECFYKQESGNTGTWRQIRLQFVVQTMATHIQEFANTCLDKLH